MSKKQQLLKDLKSTISDFILDLKNIFEKSAETRDLTTIEFFYKRLHEQTVMKNIIDNMLPYKDYIETKNLNFFKDNTSIFSSLPTTRVEYYKNEILGGKRLDSEDINMIWDYLDTMTALAESYLKA